MAQVVEQPLEAWRIAEIRNGKVFSLFHGTNGSREIPLEQWTKCCKKEVDDGGTSYISGWHFFKNKFLAIRYFERAFEITKDRYIVRCFVFGSIRRKYSGACWLADEIWIEPKDVLEALRGG